MVLLVRKIDKLQEKLLLNYLEYRKSEKIYNMTLDALKKREQIYLNSQNKPREEVIIADVYYRNAQNKRIYKKIIHPNFTNIKLVWQNHYTLDFYKCQYC